MLRMAHQILHANPICIWNGSTSKQRSAQVLNECISTIKSCPVLIADNIASYFNEYGSSKKCSEFPKVTPPLSPLFVEFYDSESQHTVGVLSRTIDARGVSMSPACDPTASEAIECRWLVHERYFLFYQNTLTFIGVSALFRIAEDGSTSARQLIDFDEQDVDGKFRDFVVRQLPRFSRMFLMSMSFMNCKNVSQHDATLSHGPPAKWLRRQKQPTIKYRVLNIAPMREVLRTEGDIENNGLQKALHICRGHFATYTADKPLFGNIVGTVWKPAHVRGDIKQGAVVKDYSVSPPVK